MNIAIIGGGIIGLSSAYYLNKAGHQVTVIDQGDLSSGCSFGNAGMIVPSHFIPLASPGMIAKGVRWMFSATSPFYVRPRLRGDLIKWGYEFYRHATKEHVERAIPVLKEISLLSKHLYLEWARDLPFDFGFEHRGLMMLYQQRDTEAEEIETAKEANRIGIEAHVLTPREVQAMEPDVEVYVRGGIYFPGDAHVIPQRLMAGLRDYLEEKGVVFKINSEVTDFVVEDRIIKEIRTGSAQFAVDEVVLAAGSWSGMMAAKLGISLPMQAGKGYSFTLPGVEKNVRIPSIFLEARVAVTPMENSLRFGGTMEIAGINKTINMKRVKGIVDSIARYYPGINVSMPSAEKIWHGLRPCSPDGLPYIGRTRGIDNLVIATGHSMMGISLGPATGKLVAELVNNERPGMELAPFRPERF